MTSLLAILRSILIVTCLAVLAGCQTMGGAGLVSSSVTAELTPKGASAIVPHVHVVAAKLDAQRIMISCKLSILRT